MLDRVRRDCSDRSEHIVTTSTTGLRPPPESERQPERHGGTPSRRSSSASAPSCGRSWAWWPSAPRPRPRFTATASQATARPTPNTPRLARRSAKSSSDSSAKPRPKTRSNGGRSSTPRSTGEAKAKAEFAAASRKIATMFDAARDTVKSDYATGKAEAAADPRLEPEEGRQGERREEQADRRQRPAGRLDPRIAWHSSPPSTRNSARSRSPGSRLRVVREVQRSRRRAVHAAGADGSAPQAARRTDHPQVDERRARSLGLHPLDLAVRRAGRC